MLSAIGSSLSGMQAAFKMLDVSAHNTANANTNGFKSQTISLNEGDTGGVVVEIGQNEESGGLYRSTDGKTYEASNTDYAEEAVNQITAKNLLAMNKSVLETADDMYQSIIDIMA